MSCHLPPSLSQSALLLSPCLAWADPGARWYDDKYADTSKRDKGTNVHRIIDCLLTNRPIEVGFSDEEYRLASIAYGWFAGQLQPRISSFFSEAVVGINWTSGEAKRLPEVQHRQYPNLPGWQHGTSDLVCLLADGSLYVGDWKTGGSDGASDQLKSLAFAFLSSGIGNNSLPVTISTLFIDENGCWPHEEVVSQEDLKQHAESMRMQWEDIGKRNEKVPGIHCVALYCNHLAYCSAIASTVQDLADADTAKAGGLVPAERLTMKLTDTPKDDYEAGDVIQACSAADRQIKYYKSVMKEYVQKSGGRVIAGQFEWKDVGNGYRWYKIKT